MVIYHPWSDGTWGAFVPDVPEVVAVGATREEAAGAIDAALADHERSLLADGRPLPAPAHVADTVRAGRPLAGVSATG